MDTNREDFLPLDSQLVDKDKKKSRFSAGAHREEKLPLISEHRVSDEGMLVMFENELNYCLKSLSAFTLKTQNNAQYKLIINQFYSLFKKYDGHLDEVLLLEKLVDAGEKLTCIRGFHALAKERCFEEARARMEGSSFGTSMESSMSVFTDAESDITTSAEVLYEGRPRRTFGNLLTTYFNLKYRIEYGVLLSSFLSLIEYDYGLKSPASIKELSHILQSFRITVEFAYKIAIDDAIWVVVHGIYHFLEISKFAIQQTQSIELLNGLKWIQPLLLEGDLFKSDAESQFHLQVYLELFGLNYSMNQLSTCHEIICDGLELFLNLKEATMGEKGSTIALDTAIKHFYTMALALKTGPGMKVPEKLLSRTISFEGSAEIIATSWENAVKSIGANKSIRFWYQYSRKQFSTDLKFGGKDLMESSLQRIVSSLTIPIDYGNIPTPISCTPDPVKKKTEDRVEDVKTDEVAVVAKSVAPPQKKGTKDSSKKTKAAPSHSGTKKIASTKANLAVAAEKKKLAPKEESEDSKLKRAWLSDFSLSMALFEKKVDKMICIVHCVQFLVPNTQSLKYTAKLDEKKEQIVLSLLDIGFDLANSISSEEKVPVDIIMRLCRFYYHFHQWPRLNQLFAYLQTLNLGSDQCWKEVQLRVAIVNLANSFQTSRKVFFDAATATMSSKTLEMHFSDETKQQMGILCTLVCKFMNTEQQDIHIDALFLDLAILLWSHLEPFLRRVKSTENTGIPIDDTVLDAVQFLHSMFCRIPYFTDVNAIVVGLGIALKLSLIFESRELYEKSRAREQNLGSCLSEIDCFTADISFIPLGETERLLKADDSLSLLRREFSSFHVDVLCSLYRCKLKNYRQKESTHILLKQEEIFKLNHIHVQLKRAVLSSEDIVKEHCGNDPTRRALFLMSILNVEEDLEADVRQKLMERIRDYLVSAKSLEVSYLKQNQGHTNAPIILRKTGNTVAVSIPSNAVEDRKTFSIYCSSAEKNSTDVIGSSIEHLKSQSNEIFLYSLKSNWLYEIYYLTSDIHGTHIRSASRQFISCLPLHIPLCWVYFSQLSMDLKNVAMSTYAKNIVVAHLIHERRDIYDLLKHPEQDPFKLRDCSIQRVTQPFMNGFVQLVFSHAEYEKQEFANNSLPKSDVIKSQALRMKICFDYLMAAHCAETINNHKLVLLCIIKAYQECIPFLEQGFYSPIFINILLRCHSCLQLHATEFEEERVKGLADFLVPITYYLVDQLLKKENSDSNALIGKIFQETTTLINITSSSVDTRILSSATIESNLIGYNFKIPQVKAKKGSSSFYADFGYHGVLALGKSVSAGLQPRKLFDLFFEQLEITIVKYKIQMPNADLQKKLLTSRRFLDTITSLKDVYGLFLLAGPEAVIQELLRFKKNPRYVEIVSEVIHWSFEKELYDPAIRFSYDLEDFLDKRTQSILHMEELNDDASHDRKEIIVKRKKRPLFTIGQKNLDAIKQSGAEKIGKHQKGKTTKKQTTSNAAPSVQTHSEHPKVLPRPKSTTSMSNQSVADSGANTPRAHSPGPHESEAKKNRRKKLQTRFNYFNGLPQPEREKKEKAAKILDNSLSALWKRVRYRRRLRALLDYDSPWRSNAMNTRGKSLLAQIRKDGKASQVFEAKEQSNTELFEFRKSGALILNHFSTKDHSGINFDLFQAQNQLYIDCLQSMVQAVVLAHRAAEHLKVLKCAKSFWNTIQALLKNGKLDAEFWKITLWKGFLVVGEVLLTTLSSIRIFRKDKDDLFLSQKDPDIKNFQKTKLPVDNSRDLYEGTFIAVWIDKYRIKQQQQIDLCFCGEFLLFTIEMLNVAAMPFRVVHFAKQVQLLFDEAHGSILAPLIKYLPDKNIKEIKPNAAVGISNSFQMRATARYYASTVFYQMQTEGKFSADMSHLAEHYYEEAFKLADQEGKSNLFGYTLIELGDFLFTINKTTAATVYWEKGVDSILKRPHSIKTIKESFSFNNQHQFSLIDSEKYLKRAKGSLNALVLANTLAKIARFVYTKNHDAQCDLIWIAAHLVFSVLSSNVTHPSNYYGYATFSSNAFVQKNSFLFNDKFLLDSLQFSENLLYLSKELIDFGFGSVTFPLLSLFESISIVRFDSISLFAKGCLLKCDAFAQLGMINEALSIIQAITRIKPKSEENLTDVTFNSFSKPFNSLQVQSVKNILGLNLSEKLRSIFPSQFSTDFEICKLRTILSIFTWVDVYEDSSSTQTDASTGSKIDLRSNDSHLLVEHGFEALELLKAHCFKLFTILQQSINNQGDLPLFDQTNALLLTDWQEKSILHTQILKVSDIISKVYYSRKFYADSLEWALSVRKNLANFKPQKYLYESITARLGRKFLLSNREMISYSYIAVGDYNTAFKIMDETALLYEKWKSKFSAASLCLLKMKSLDANQPESAFETRHRLACAQMEKLAIKLEEHPYGLVLLPQIYDALIDEMDLSLPVKSASSPFHQEKDWKLLKRYSDKCLNFEKLFFQLYTGGGDSLLKYSKELSIRRIRASTLEIITTSDSSRNSIEKQLIQLSSLIEDSYPLNKSYCRLALYVISNILLLHAKSIESTQFAKRFLNDFMKKSLGAEFVDCNFLQHIYLTLLTLDSATDTNSASDYLLRAYQSSQARSFTVAYDTLMNVVGPEKIPIDILIDLGSVRSAISSENLETMLVNEEQEIAMKKTLISTVTLESLNAYIAKIEKEISASIICPHGLRYRNLLAKWRRLHQLFRPSFITTSNTSDSPTNSSPHLQSITFEATAKKSTQEGSKEQCVLLGWLSNEIVRSDQVSSQTLDYLEGLRERFIPPTPADSSSKKGAETPIFRSPRSKIAKPKPAPKFHILAIVSRVSVTAPALVSQAKSTDQLIDGGAGTRPKSGKKQRPGSSKLVNISSNQPTSVTAESSLPTAITKMNEVQTMRHIPEAAIQILQKVTKQLIIALGNFDVAEDEAFKEEATELWSIITLVLSRLMSGETASDSRPAEATPPLSTPKPAMNMRNAMLVEKLLDLNQVSGWIEAPPTQTSAKSSASNVPVMAADRDSEFFKWLVGNLSQ